MTTPQTSRLPGFYKLSLEKRRELIEAGFTNEADALAPLFDVAAGLDVATADHMVENAVGVFGLPLGLGLNFIIDDQPVLVPMAVEEPSVVAACSYIARIAAEGGGFRTENDPPLMVGQIQVLGLTDPDAALDVIARAKAPLMSAANGFCPGLVERGGGCVDVEARKLKPLREGPHADLDSDEVMVVIHVTLDCRDAMGANAINTVVEGLAPRVEELTGGTVRLRILSNLSDRRCARAFMKLPYRCLGKAQDGVDAVANGREVAQGIVDAYRFAARDPYRACTHNKGIMNGVDAVAIATGNDWRAIEAGAHAYAARSGRYTSLTRFWLDDDAQALAGSIEIPMAIGTVGGATRVHPTVKACRLLMGDVALKADSLAGVLAAVGLSQNTAALKALATEGIQRGHMTLHARQVALAAGASSDEVERVAARLVEEGCIRPARAEELLQELKSAGGAV